MATATEVKIDDRYGIVQKFRIWRATLESLIAETTEGRNSLFWDGYQNALQAAEGQLIEINREAQRIADANRGEHA